MKPTTIDLDKPMASRAEETEQVWAEGQYYRCMKPINSDEACGHYDRFKVIHTQSGVFLYCTCCNATHQIVFARRGDDMTEIEALRKVVAHYEAEAYCEQEQNGEAH